MSDKMTPAVATPVTPDLYELNAVMCDMQTDLENARDCLNHIVELLFNGTEPSDLYDIDYTRFCSMLHLVTTTLGRFAGMYNLIVSGEGNGFTNSDQKNIESLKALGDWWRVK